MQPNRYLVLILSLTLPVGGLLAQPVMGPVVTPTSAPASGPASIRPAWRAANDRGELPGPDGRAMVFWSEHCTPRGRLLALREAKKRAVTQLAAQLLGLKVADKLTVGDFLAASDEPDVDVNTFLLGADEKAVRYFPTAPVLEVQMQISVISAVTSFKGWADRHVKGDWAEKLPKVLKYIESKKAQKLTLTAEALAAVPAEYCKKLPAEAAAIGAMIRDLPAALVGPVVLSTAVATSQPASAESQPATSESQPASGPVPVKTLKEILATSLVGELSLKALAEKNADVKAELDKILKAAKPVKKGSDLKTFDFRPLWRLLCAKPERLK